jgi:hypothetical protein
MTHNKIAYRNRRNRHTRTVTHQNHRPIIHRLPDLGRRVDHESIEVTALKRCELLTNDRQVSAHPVCLIAMRSQRYRRSSL